MDSMPDSGSRPQDDSPAPWPLATSAASRVLAWPRYDSPEDLDALAAAVAEMDATPGGCCICVRHDADVDGASAAAVPMIEKAMARITRSDVEVLVVDDAIAAADLPRLGKAIGVALRLPGCDEQRASFLRALGTTVVDVARQRARDRRGAIERWVDRAYADDAPYVPPVRLDIALTQACNIRCAYCWQQEKKKSVLRFDDVAAVLDETAAIWPPSITFTGGEPTVWPDFLRLVSYGKRLGTTQMKLISNGLRLADAAFASAVVEAGVTSINLSADTLDPERFERLRGFPFDRFAQAVGNLIALRRANPSLTITVGSVLHREVTPEEVHEVGLLCRKFGFCHFVQTFLDTAYPDVNARFALTGEERRAFHDRLDGLEGSVAAAVKREGSPLTGAKRERCHKGVTTVKIHPDGGVSFCWSTRVIGNIRDTPFMEIWTSPAARDLRAFIREGRCECNFDCDVFESLELPRSAAEIHRV